MGPGVRNTGDVTILDLPNRVTHAEGALEMRETIQHILDEGKRKFIVNLEKTSFMDSAGIGELVACHKRAVEKGGVIKVLKANEKMLDLFAITKLIEIFDLYTDERAKL